MKQQIFIIAGALLVILLLAVWAYLFFSGTPKTADTIFSDFGQSGNQDNTVIPLPDVNEPTPIINMERDKLRQLTTKPVAGFREIMTATNTEPKLIYVESGTGHVYSLGIDSGEEKRISGTTIAKAKEAAISTDGRYVAISAEGNTKSKDLILGELSTSSESLIEKFSKSVQDFSIGSSSELLYTISGDQGLTGYAYNFNTDITKNIFSIPFHEAVIDWGNTSNSPHYVYPKTTYALEGFLYEIKNGNMSRLPLHGFGFSAKANSDMILYDKIVGQNTTSYVYDRKNSESRVLDAAVVPEKCYLLSAGLEFICSFESITFPYEFPDEWYKGNMSFKDSLWLLDADTMTGQSLVDTYKESGREIDIINLDFSPDSTNLYFINKNDNTLWMYDL